MSKTIELDTRGLDQFIKAMKRKKRIGRIGILGSQKNTRNDSKNTNAKIGAKHEYGLNGMPVRSFLRVPLSMHLYKYLEKAGAFDEETFKKILAESDIKPWLEKVMIVAEQVVSDAFDTGGFGKWKKSDMRRKKNHQTLVETQQLRNSITSEVI